MQDPLMPGAAIFAPTGELAQQRLGYSHDSEIKASNPDWMARLQDSRRLSELSIPGTHDTMSFYGGDIGQTQSLPFADQLRSGIRAIDIRCKHIKDELPIYHGIFQYAYLSDVLATVADFLKLHPGETVIMRISDVGDGGGNTQTFEKTFATSYYDPNKDMFWQGSGTNPSLGEMRGKIVVLQDFSSDKSYGIPYSSTVFKIQDDWEIGSNWDLYDKWEKVKSHARSAISGNPQQGYINYLSAASGSFPYFIASGNSSPQTDAPWLLTGRTTIGGWKDSWPDFPRISCLGSWCSIAFLGTNQLLYPRLAKGGELNGRVGIVMSDFPGPGLINGIIGCNAP